MAAMEQRYGGEYSPFQPDVLDVYHRIEDVDSLARQMATPPPAAPAAEAAAAKPPPAAAPEGVEYWRGRLRAAITPPGQPGYDPERYLQPYASSDPFKMRRRLEAYSKAAITLAEFRQAHYGTRPTLELQQLALDIEYALRRFGMSCVEHADAELAEAEISVGNLERFAALQNERLERGEPVELVDRQALDDLGATLVRAARLVPADDACLSDLRVRVARLRRHDERLRALRATDAAMLPDLYAGNDAVAVKQGVDRVVQEARPGARILKTSIVSPAWRVESHTEWADPLQSVLQERVLRKMNAHVAIRENEETFLVTVGLRQDQLPGKRWGPVIGEIVFVDPMLPENVR
jgi:hypothetical protein